jgi:PAS domain S-box-containing protein
VGVIAVANREDGYSLEQQKDLEAIAPAIIQVLQRKRTEQERKQAEEKLRWNKERSEILSEVTSRLLASDKPQEIVEDLCFKVMNFLDCHAFFNYLVDKEKGCLHLNACAGISDEMAKSIEWLNLKEAICGYVAHNGQRIVAENILETLDPRTELLKSSGIMAYVCNPLMNHAEVLGTLSFGTRSRIRFSNDELEMMKAVADEVAIAMIRFRAEEALRKSEAKYRQIVETAQEGIWLIDGNDKTIFINQRMSEMLGYSIEEILGQSPQKFMPPEFREKAGNRLHEHMQGANHVIDHKFTRKDGSGLWCILSSHALFDDKGDYAGSLAMITDITERKQYEQQLFDVNQRLEALMNALPVGVSFSYDATCQNITGNPAALAQFEISQEDNLSASSHDGSAPGRQIRYFLNGRQISDAELPLQRAVTENREIPPMELEVELPSGRRWFAEASGAPIHNEKGNVVGGVAVSVDITERKGAEEKIKILANAVESSNDAIITESLEGFVTSWNRGAEQIYGYSAGEMLGKNISVLEPVNLKGEMSQLIEKIKNNERVSHYETVRLKKDNTLINISVTFSPIFNNSGELVAVSGISRDITERIKAERALAKIEVARLKEIHHRIKNNLQVISSLLDLQAGNFNDKEVREAFKESQDRVISMALIHEELYKGNGTDTLNFSAYLQKLTENLFQTYNLRSKNIHLYMDLEENAFFNIDIAVPLGIIVNELISNVLKHAFTEAEEGEIRIQLSREKADNKADKSLFSLIISDNGKGIPKGIKFENLESLGLQLVNALVNQLDGKIEIKRENGTEFRITFNVAENKSI